MYRSIPWPSLKNEYVMFSVTSTVPSGWTTTVTSKAGVEPAPVARATACADGAMPNPTTVTAPTASAPATNRHADLITWLTLPAGNGESTQVSAGHPFKNRYHGLTRP